MLNVYSKTILLFLISFKTTDSTVLLWGPEQLRFPALQQFTNKHLDEILNQFQSNQIITFESKTLEVANIISTNLQNETTAYIPSSKLDLRNLNVSELTGDSAADILTIEKALKQSNIKSHQNNLIVLLIKEDSNINKIPKHPDNSILYSASQWDNKPVGAVLSSKPPLFETNSSSISLKEATFTTFDGREDSPRLISSIPTNDGKITLTFKFLWLNDYWHFTSIEGVLVNKYDIKEFVLIPNVDIKALRHFSYRCDGDTIFTDTENGVKLHLFDLQVQPDRVNHKFSKAYDCSRRTKRDVEDEVTTTTTTEKPYEEPSGSPILYSAPFPDNKDSEAMVYSSKPPLLRTNSSLINLGEATSTQVDVRETYTRLIATISVENGKITMRFKFSWLSGYWYLNSVEVQFIGDYNAITYNLTINQEISAPKRFSYHCGGQVSLVDTENDVELIIYGIQAQPDAFKHRFSDAYNCIPFTTGPLLSGLFVTFILIIGLIIGLTALDNIKTMDKFDNHKTKQLSITVSE